MIRSPRSAVHTNQVESTCESTRAGAFARYLQETSTNRLTFFLVLATTLVCINIVGGEFVFDDPKQIINNLRIHSWTNVYYSFTTAVWDFQRDTNTTDLPPPYYRPLFTIYLTIGYKLFGLWAQGWHLASLVAHVAATILVFRFLIQITGNQTTAFIVALIFGLHSAHTESVAWISAIPDPMMTLFYVPSLMWYDRFRKGDNVKYLLLSVTAFGLATLSKETALSLPVLLVCWELLRGEWKTLNGAKRISFALTPFAIVSIAYMAARVAVLGTVVWKHPAMLAIPNSLIYMSIPYALINYLYHLVVPYDLSIIYGTSFITGATDPRFYVPSFLLLVIASLLIFFRRRVSSNTWLALALIIVPLLPVLNLKALHEEYIVQDRYLYLSVIGFAWLVAMLMQQAFRKLPTQTVALGIVFVCALGVNTIVQNRVWHNSITLWQQAIRYAPNFWSTQYNLGLAYFEHGELDAAESQFKRALDIKPVPSIYNNLALVQAKSQRRDEAITSLERALQLDPHLAEAHNNLGTLFYEARNFEAARRQFEQALIDEPASLATRFNLARTANMMNDNQAAVFYLNQLLAKNPTDTDARFLLAQSFAAMNRQPEAVAQLNLAIANETQPQRAAEMRRALFSLR